MPIQLPGFLVSVFQKQLKMFLHDGFIHFEFLSGLIIINTIIFLRLRFLTCWLCCAFLYVGRGANNLSLILALRVGSGFGGNCCLFQDDVFFHDSLCFLFLASVNAPLLQFLSILEVLSSPFVLLANASRFFPGQSRVWALRVCLCGLEKETYKHEVDGSTPT